VPETSRPTEQLTDRSWIEEKATRKLVAAFDAAGIDFRFVGGAVRDSLLGRSVSDIDVATSARPTAPSPAWSGGGISRSRRSAATSKPTAATPSLPSPTTGVKTPRAATSP
jgi:poly(A) polymerase